MMLPYDSVPNAPLDDELVAAIVAVQLYLAAEQPGAPQVMNDQPQAWRDTAIMLVQGVQPVKTTTSPRWQTIERLRRAGRGSSGIIGI